MQSFKNTAILVIVLGCISLSFTNRKSAKLNKLLNQVNSFYPVVLDENGKLSISKCKDHEDEILQFNERIATISLQRSDEAMQKMLFVHAFNLQVLKKINDYFPLKDIETIDDFYDGNSFTVSRGQYTLRTLKYYLMGKYKDPRVLFCLYFGGNSSPSLSFIKDKDYEKVILAKTESFLNEKQMVRIKSKSHLLLLPEFMKWYFDDFNLNDHQGYIKYVNEYLQDNKIPDDYEVKFYPYSWKLD